MMMKMKITLSLSLLYLCTPSQVVAESCAYGPDTCKMGFVWREAFPGDHVCVPPSTRAQARRDNAQADNRREPNGGHYGPDTCIRGYVWREARPGDHVCVTPQTRSETRRDNARAQSRRANCSPYRPPPGGYVGSGGSNGNSGTCDDEGSACEAHPSECFGRGADWTVPGRIECIRGESVCKAAVGTDYCTICGGKCGACYGQSCSAQNLCAPRAICVRAHSPSGSRNRCNSLTIPEASTGRVPCRPVSGFCWLPSEVGMETLGCAN